LNSTDLPNHSKPFPEPPDVVASFTEPHENAQHILLAIGRTVWGATGLERTLLHAVNCLLAEREGLTPKLDQKLSRLEERTAGQLHEELRNFDLPEDLDQRIDDAIKRRNAIMHRMVEEPEMVRAVVTGERIDDAVARVEQVALDCGRIAKELFLAFLPWVEVAIGKSWSGVIGLFTSLDLEKIKRPYRAALFPSPLPVALRCEARSARAARGPARGGQG
jgi:hypothetical protein